VTILDGNFSLADESSSNGHPLAQRDPHIPSQQSVIVDDRTAAIVDEIEDRLVRSSNVSDMKPVRASLW
jgi:hypothetical protein